MLDECTMPLLIINDVRTVLGESPLWTDDALYWTDVNGATLHWIDGCGDIRAKRWDRPVVAVAATTDPSQVLVVLGDHVALFGPRSGHVIKVAAPSIGWPGRRFNDAVIDSAGRLLVGTMRNNITPGGAHLDLSDTHGEILAIGADGSSWPVGISGLGCPNGLAFSPDGGTLYWADSASNRMMAGDYDASSATVSHARQFAAPFERGVPDGSAVDDEGGLWNARFGGSCVVRFTPDGAVNRVVDVPMTNPTCVAFGGDDGRAMFITSAQLLAPEGEAADGAVAQFDAGVAGAPGRCFALQTSAMKAGS